MDRAPRRLHVLLGDSARPELRWRAAVRLCQDKVAQGTEHRQASFYAPFDSMTRADVLGHDNDNAAPRASPLPSPQMELRRVSSVGFMIEDEPGTFEVEMMPPHLVAVKATDRVLVRRAERAKAGDALVTSGVLRVVRGLAPELWKHLNEVSTLTLIEDAVVAAFVALVLVLSAWNTVGSLYAAGGKQRDTSLPRHVSPLAR